MIHNPDDTNADNGADGVIPGVGIDAVNDATADKKPTRRGGNSPTKKTSAKTNSTKANGGTSAKKPARKTTTKTSTKTTKEAVNGDGVANGDRRANKTCDCPLCGQDFIPADGVTVGEHLAMGVIQVFSEMQTKPELEVYTKNPLPCPRCGQYRMSDKVTRNAKSRHAKVYVCDICGTDEAVREYSGEVLPMPDWWVVREILTRKSGV